MRRLGIAETLRKTMEQPEDQRGEFLRRQYNPAIGTIIQNAFDPAIVYALPEGEPPFKKSQFVDATSMLYGEIRRLYLFQKGPSDHLKQRKREELFVGMLEAIAVDDAELMICVKDKKLPYDITEDMIREWLPGLLPEKVEQRELPSGEFRMTTTPPTPVETIRQEQEMPKPEPEKKEPNPKRVAAMAKAREARMKNLAAKKAQENQSSEPEKKGSVE